MRRFVRGLLWLPLLWCLGLPAWAHGVAQGDKGYIKEIEGVNTIPFIYLGAKHMFTGYDHILFLLGVIFFLYKLKDIAIYVSLFALGHSTTMLLGVYFGTTIDGHLIDAIIGLSVVYKSMDNIGAFQRWFGVQPNTKVATLVFGFFHGFGLATKIQEYNLSPDVQSGQGHRGRAQTRASVPAAGRRRAEGRGRFSSGRALAVMRSFLNRVV
jgi:hypothetical protein